LANCIANIDELILEYCYIDAKGAAVLFRAIEQRPRKVRFVEMLHLRSYAPSWYFSF